MGKLVLVRHGESVWNLQNRFTGWVDINLSKRGILEAKRAGKLLSEFKFDVAFSSDLLRANETLQLILEKNSFIFEYIVLHDDKNYDKFNSNKVDDEAIYVIKDWRLNERHYGDLEGLNKDDTRKKFGDEQVHIWRRSYNVAPPNGECLKDTYARCVPYFRSKILKQVKNGKNVLVAAHGNSLRAIIKYLEKISAKEILNVEIGTGKPIVYDIDKKGIVKSKNVLK